MKQQIKNDVGADRTEGANIAFNYLRLRDYFVLGSVKIYFPNA